MKPFNKYIDHTLLKPDAGEADIIRLCTEALKYDFYSVCISGYYIPLVRRNLENSDVKIAAVIGFPLGTMSSAAKIAEAEDSLKNGAHELDAVINIGALKNNRRDYIYEEISVLADLCHKSSALLKVILETCLLTDDEIIHSCEICKDAGADFIKTSTGFSTGGATARDIRLMKETVGDDVMVKASGGIRTLDFALELIDAGADRIGASASVAMMEEYSKAKETSK